jgi:AraC-like DNA-binding protein
LLGLPHNYTERFQRQKAAAAPGNVRRAEAFMQANASLPLSIAEISEAAGCGVRALQIAFHRFRGTTPMRVLQQARLEQARTEMLRPGQTQSLARIAAEHGFSSPTQFAQFFRRKYGFYPSEMLRERRDILAGLRDVGPPAMATLDEKGFARHTGLTPKINSFFISPIRFS